MLIDDRAVFQETGLATMTAEENRALADRYGAFRGNPYADEVLAWLAGDYAFDPACLT